LSVNTSPILPCLWLPANIEEAIAFYVRLFEDAEVRHVQKMPDGSVLAIRFRVRNQEFLALGGRPDGAPTDVVSFQIDCADQAEVDHFWDGLVAGGGKEIMCGWLRDRFGVTWQVVPSMMPGLLSRPDQAGAQRAFQAMMKMKKLVIADLEAAYRGE
jgi:predicted 3-demethylubiquinone-9 3-methyltransferase (glyoxalase superfamily)